VLTEGDNQILEVCRSGKMTMRRGHHTSRVLKAMGAAEAEADDTANQTLQAEEGAVVEPE
jgi:acetolactate synthase I/III small subunit